MPNNIPPRYLPTYRECEISFICRQANRGESICFVGIAGSGKSNLIKSLRDNGAARCQAAGHSTGALYFPDIDATGWDETAESLWGMMLAALRRRVTDGLTPPPPPAGANTLESLEHLINWVCQAQQCKIMFMLDEFDDVLRKGPRSVFETLSRLRGAGNRERLSYLVFTRKLPHILGRKHELATRSKFYDLIRYNVVALPLHDSDDSRQMLLHLNALADNTLSRDEINFIRGITGGHARLIKVTFEVWLRERPAGEGVVEQLACQPEIQDECSRILNGLHRQERDVALRFGRNQRLPLDEPTIDHLRRRGLLLANDEWFSPLMGVYLRELRV